MHPTLRDLLIASAVALSLGMSGSAIAQLKAGGGESHVEADSRGALPTRIRASEIVGKPVTNVQNETLGKIIDVVVERDRGVTQAILQVGGALGLGGKQIALGYDELRLDDKGGYVLDTTLEALKARPAYAAKATDLSAERDARTHYSEEAGSRIDEWKGKLDAYTSKAESEGSAAGRAAADKLNRAWESVKTQWDKLGAATGDTWQDAKDAFEKAWETFQRDWKETTSDT